MDLEKEVERLSKANARLTGSLRKLQAEQKRNATLCDHTIVFVAQEVESTRKFHVVITVAVIVITVLYFI